MQPLRYNEWWTNENSLIIDSELSNIATKYCSNITWIIWWDNKIHEKEYAVDIAFKLLEIIEDLIKQWDLKNETVQTNYWLAKKPSFLNELKSLFTILKTKILLDWNKNYEDFYKLNSKFELFFVQNKWLIIDIFNNLWNKDSLIHLINELNENWKNIARDFPDIILNSSSIH